MPLKRAFCSRAQSPTVRKVCFATGPVRVLVGVPGAPGGVNRPLRATPERRVSARPMEPRPSEPSGEATERARPRPMRCGPPGPRPGVSRANQRSNSRYTWKACGEHSRPSCSSSTLRPYLSILGSFARSATSTPPAPGKSRCISQRTWNAILVAWFRLICLSCDVTADAPAVPPPPVPAPLGLEVPVAKPAPAPAPRRATSSGPV
mmetsp:Transcript_42948/g.138050  ORF Transcript_42948/g.138050 Transcript_42948/m.138050 type:complete len:206 (-) Transcript_42948:756-1373(-)